MYIIFNTGIKCIRKYDMIYIFWIDCLVVVGIIIVNEIIEDKKGRILVRLVGV